MQNPVLVIPFNFSTQQLLDRIPFLFIRSNNVNSKDIYNSSLQGGSSEKYFLLGIMERVLNSAM